MTTPEAFASISINRIFEKVADIEKHLAVMACDLTALRGDTKDQLHDLDARVDALEEDRFPWKKIGALVAVAALVVSVVFGVLAIQDDGHPPPPPRPTSGP